MKIVIAPDSYKESLSAQEVAACIAAGFKQVFPHAEYVQIPLADGGEGTARAMVAATGGKIIPLTVTGPLGKPVNAFYGLSGDNRLAFIEMAAASGLELLSQAERNPLLTTSYGTGELIRHALRHPVSKMIIGIGGSATNDGGAGMLQALGAQLLDRQGKPLPYGGASLPLLEKIDLSTLEPRLQQCQIEVACDVTNPLIGANGASAVFGPQKGATAQMVTTLEQGLHHYAAIIKRDLAVDVAALPGGGAAGGMGAALYACCQAQLRSGIEIVTDTLQLDKAIRDASLVITGEGRLDSQSIQGKVPVGVARIAKRYGKPVIAIAGSLGQEMERVHQQGIDALFSVIYRVCSLEEALGEAAQNVRMAAYEIAAAVKIGCLLQPPDHHHHTCCHQGTSHPVQE